MIPLTSTSEAGRVRVLENGATAVPLHPKNQVTLPAEIARALGARPGDRLQFAIDPENPETATVRRIRESYLGALAGAYGETHEQQLAYLRAEQDGWAD
jgi:bifunctional DNA-binding transcriptional regulator/antitoxin component of YhaV-PrlF toxin-antitoxin module